AAPPDAAGAAGGTAAATGPGSAAVPGGAALPEASSGGAAAPAGVGSTAESLAHDPAVEALLADVAWDGSVRDLGAWLRGHVRLRYGSGSEDLQEAWRILRAERYGAADPPLSVVQCRPRVGPGLEPDRPLNLAGPAEAAFSPALVRAWDLLLRAALRDGAGPALGRDLVDVGDAVLTGAAARHRAQAADAFLRGDLPALESAGSALLARIADLDALAAALPDRRLSTAASAARTAGCAPGEGPRLRADALRLLTVWVEPGHPLEDYAGRHWSGLLGRYYLPRWRLWTAALRTALTRAASLSPARFDAALDAFERSWLLNPATAPLRPPEDPVAVSERLYPRFAAARERHGR
ncbi:alpha-N-acetylglucosaminidase C-terminal domain-containing protein, partial [Nocardiopsis coralliicola]